MTRSLCFWLKTQEIRRLSLTLDPLLFKSGNTGILVPRIYALHRITQAPPADFSFLGLLKDYVFNKLPCFVFHLAWKTFGLFKLYLVWVLIILWWVKTAAKFITCVGVNLYQTNSVFYSLFWVKILKLLLYSEKKIKET